MLSFLLITLLASCWQRAATGTSCKFPVRWSASAIITEPVQRLSDDRGCQNATVSVDYNAQEMELRAMETVAGSVVERGRWRFRNGTEASELVRLRRHTCRKSKLLFLHTQPTLGAMETTQELHGLTPVPGKSGLFESVIPAKEFALMDSQFRHHLFRRSLCTAWFLSSRLIFRVRLRGDTCIPVAVLRLRDDGYACQVYNSYMKRSSNYQVRLRKGVLELVMAIQDGSFQESLPEPEKDLHVVHCAGRADASGCGEKVQKSCLSPEEMERKANRCCGKGCKAPEDQCDAKPIWNPDKMCRTMM